MSFTLGKDFLMDIIQKTFPVVPARTSLQVLYNFKITIEAGVITITASDLDNFVRASTTVEGSGEAEIAVNAKKLFEIIREVENGGITLEIENNALHISSDSGFSCQLAGVDLREFPYFPDSGYAETYTISTPVFRGLVEKSSFAVSKDESRASLCGVLWECSLERIGMVATDGHRLGASFAGAENGIPQDISVIVSPKSLQHIQKTAEISGVDAIKYAFNDKHVVFTVDTFTLSTKIIDGPYPDYDKGIPKEFLKTAIIDRDLLHSVVRRVSIFANRKTQLIKLAFSGNSLEVSAANREIIAEGKQTIPALYTGDEVHTVGFNSAYLLEILSIINTPTVEFRMNTQVSAVLVLPVIEEPTSDDVFLIMPLRIFE